MRPILSRVRLVYKRNKYLCQNDAFPLINCVHNTYFSVIDIIGLIQSLIPVRWVVSTRVKANFFRSYCARNNIFQQVKQNSAHYIFQAFSSVKIFLFPRIKNSHLWVIYFENFDNFYSEESNRHRWGGEKKKETLKFSKIWDFSQKFLRRVIFRRIESETLEFLKHHTFLRRKFLRRVIAIGHCVESEILEF